MLAALFVEELAFRQAPGPATRIDLGGVMFSLAADSPPPLTIEPSLIVLMRCDEGESGDAVLETEVWDTSGSVTLHESQPFKVAPGKFGYRVVKHPMKFSEYGTGSIRCRIDDGQWTRVPLTLLPAADALDS